MVVDDLRPNLNVAYGQKYMLTPNLDKFASTALVFRNAYCTLRQCLMLRLWGVGVSETLGTLTVELPLEL